MKDSQDAYGHAMLDYLETGEGFEIAERDDGFISISAGPEYYFADFIDWPAHQKRALESVRGRVLDIGCGAGRVSLALQERGLEVTGVDISPLAIEVCKRRGLRDARVIPATRLSAKVGRFDTLVMMGNNFGLLANPRRARWLLKRFYKMTPVDGRILAESNDIYRTERPVHLDYHNRNRKRGRMAGQIRLRIRYLHYTTPWFDYLMVSPDELRSILNGTGWRVSHIYPSDGSVYIALIEKTH
jgi:SAM-dependent methyltransferase